MALCIWHGVGGGGGLDPDELTALPEHVLDGKVAGVHGYDEGVSGTMPERGDWSPTELAAGASVTVPGGHHSGAGKVTAKDLASQTQGNAHAGAILAGHNAWVNGANVAGGIPSYGGQTVSPQTYAQTLAIAGHYNTGNVVVNPFPLPPAEWLRAGVNWYGVVGTSQGFVATGWEIYNRGAWGMGISGGNVIPRFDHLTGSSGMSGVNFEQSAMYIRPCSGGYTSVCINVPINLSPYKTVNVTFSGTSTERFPGVIYVFNGFPDWMSPTNGAVVLKRGEGGFATTENEATVSCDIGALNIPGYIAFKPGTMDGCYIKRIWFT